MGEPTPGVAARAVNLVVAHRVEARPILRHFGLIRVAEADRYPLYERDLMRLIVSGQGRVRSAAAAEYLFMRGGQVREQAWLNVGIAGHADLALGTVCLAHRVRDGAGTQSVAPRIDFLAPCATAEVITVDAVENDYPEPALYEMEAMGFCRACAQFSPPELVHVLKIVSDNRKHPTSELRRDDIDPLVGRAADVIAQVAGALSGVKLS